MHVHRLLRVYAASSNDFTRFENPFFLLLPNVARNRSTPILNRFDPFGLILFTFESRADLCCSPRLTAIGFKGVVGQSFDSLLSVRLDGQGKGIVCEGINGGCRGGFGRGL
jgi:hypothetical protein